ncbi:hypothetical protein [Streptomyces sp. NPDC005385]|uniref:hypothetical protein n=1 Tax=Streptomyces sp. NPDC005385 TaxID=3157039 RepID=UPI0033BBF27C
MTDLSDLVRPGRYPLSSRYDPTWLLDLDRGPNPLWLLEDLAGTLELRPGTRIPYLGSGKGATSVFLAREFGAEVVAADWWIASEDATADFVEAAIAWHAAGWWRFLWEVTELVEVTSARLGADAWEDWLLWARAGAARGPEGARANEPVIEMLTADAGEFLSFALITARKH